MLEPNCYFDLSAVFSCDCNSPDVTLMLGQYSAYITFFCLIFIFFSQGKSLVTTSVIGYRGSVNPKNSGWGNDIDWYDRINHDIKAP